MIRWPWPTRPFSLARPSANCTTWLSIVDFLELMERELTCVERQRQLAPVPRVRARAGRRATAQRGLGRVGAYQQRDDAPREHQPLALRLAGHLPPEPHGHLHARQHRGDDRCGGFGGGGVSGAPGGRFPPPPKTYVQTDDTR